MPNVIELNRSITNVNIFAERLRHTRTLRGLSQSALAGACGLSQSAIANYENGSRKTAKDIFRLAEILGVNPIWLAQGTGPMEPLAPPVQTQTSYHLAEARALQQLAPWPFPAISPDEYWSLPDEARAIVENTLASLIKSLRKTG